VPHVSILKRVVFLGAVGGALALSAPPGYWQQMQTILKPSTDYNWSAGDGRREIAKRGMGYMMSYPVFGVGIHNFGRAEGTISEKARRHVPGTGIVWVAPHNSFVQIGAETGIPGLAIWCSLLIGSIVGLTRLRRRLPPSWARGDPEQRFIYFAAVYVPISIIGFTVTCTFLSFAYLDPVYILTAFTAGLLQSCDARLRRDGMVPETRSAPQVAHDRSAAYARRPRFALARGGLAR
jgi:O-antigen ligase